MIRSSNLKQITDEKKQSIFSLTSWRDSIELTTLLNMIFPQGRKYVYLIEMCKWFFEIFFRRNRKIWLWLRH